MNFRALWLAEVLPVFGDRVAPVALALLVYARTDSAALTALTYALTFVPAVLGGFLLSGLADRYRRRTVIVVTDVVRAVLRLLVGTKHPVVHGAAAKPVCRRKRICTLRKQKLEHHRPISAEALRRELDVGAAFHVGRGARSYGGSTVTCAHRACLFQSFGSVLLACRWWA